MIKPVGDSMALCELSSWLVFSAGRQGNYWSGSDIHTSYGAVYRIGHNNSQMQQNIPRERERAGNGLLRKGFIWKIFVDERRSRLCLTRNSDCRISSFEMSHAQTFLRCGKRLFQDLIAIIMATKHGVSLPDLSRCNREANQMFCDTSSYLAIHCLCPEFLVGTIRGSRVGSACQASFILSGGLGLQNCTAAAEGVRSFCQCIFHTMSVQVAIAVLMSYRVTHLVSKPPVDLDFGCSAILRRQ